MKRQTELEGNICKNSTEFKKKKSVIIFKTLSETFW